MIGQRVLDDPRNALVREFLRLVAELDAKHFVFENVKGLTLGKHRQFLDEFVSKADEFGYYVQLPWKVLDAAHFAVPQHRERLFLLGTKKSRTAPKYPAPWTQPADGRRRLRGDLERGPTAEEAIGDLPNADDFDVLNGTDSIAGAPFARPSAYAAELRCLTNDAWHFGYVRKWNPAVLTSSARTGHTDISKRRFAQTAGGTTEPISRFYKLAPDGLSNTLRAGTDGARGAFTSPRPIHYEHNRCVTVREMARLHGYPDWFRFHETKWHGARQIGNSVPPPLARAVAAEVMVALGQVPVRPEIPIELGNPKLLSHTVSEAAFKFDIPPPLSKRDRKSGARKRKQHEIEAERMRGLAASA
jgi:DNA (cytosine-5)-methyltransferase 1